MDRHIAVRFIELVSNIIKSQPSSTRLRRACRSIIIKDLQLRGAKVPLSLSKPRALHVEEMAHSSIMTAGNTALEDCPLRPDRMLSDHLAMHPECGPSCYFWLLHGVAARGWKLPNAHYHHRGRENHEQYVLYGEHSRQSLLKQLGGSDAIMDNSVYRLKNVKLNPLLSVVKSSDKLRSKLFTGERIYDEASLTRANVALAAIGEPEVKVRVCLDLSAGGMNKGQPNFPFGYVSPDDVASLMSRGCFMAKIDLKSQFLSLGIAYESRRRFGFKFDGKVWVYRRTPFGGKLFPAVVSTLMAEILAVARSKGCDKAVVYMDDFAVVADTEEECNRQLDILIGVIESHGWTIAHEKTVRACQELEFLGVVLNSLTMTMTIDANKAAAVMMKLDAVLSNLAHGDDLDFQMLQSLTGNLTWFSGVVILGRLYTRPVYDLMKFGLDGLNLTQVDRLHASLAWWKSTMVAWSSRHLVTSNVKVLPSESASDFYYYQGDSGDDGMGYFHYPIRATKAHWYACPWVDHVPSSSTEKELSTLLWAISSHPEWSNHVVVAVFDSSASALAINNATTDSVECWGVLHQIYEIADRINVTLAALWVERESNTFADYLTHYCVGHRTASAEGEFRL